MKFGLAMLPAESAQVTNEKAKERERQMGEKASASSDDSEASAPRKKDRFASIDRSMDFDGQVPPHTESRNCPGSASPLQAPDSLVQAPIRLCRL